MNKYQEALDKLCDLATSNGTCLNYVIGLSMTIQQALERLEQIKQVWNSEEWCQGIPCNADGLKSLFNYNLDLFNKNLTLDKRVLDLEKENQELKFLLECKSKGNEIIIKKMDLFMKQRDKTIEENERLKKENQELRETNDKLSNSVIGIDFNTKSLIGRIEELEKENQELAETLELYNEKFAGHERVKADLIKENQELKREIVIKKDLIARWVDMYFSKNKENEKLEKAIEILKSYFNFTFNDKNLGLKIMSKISSDGKGTINCIQAVENYRLMKEVLGV